MHVDTLGQQIEILKEQVADLQKRTEESPPLDINNLHVQMDILRRSYADMRQAIDGLTINREVIEAYTSAIKDVAEKQEQLGLKYAAMTNYIAGRERDEVRLLEALEAVRKPRIPWWRRLLGERA
jgi:hypothetical protein